MTQNHDRQALQLVENLVRDVATLSVSIVVLSGMFVADLKAVSGWAKWPLVSSLASSWVFLLYSVYSAVGARSSLIGALLGESSVTLSDILGASRVRGRVRRAWRSFLLGIACFAGYSAIYVAERL